jgi:hypothetical protein
VSGAGEDEWKRVVKSEWRRPFSVEIGPLFRVSLVRSPGRSDLIVTGHHVVCDGTSLTYLIRDIMAQLADPEREIEALAPPPPIDETTVPSPKRMNFLARWIMNLVNWKWRRQNISFGQADMERMHDSFWQANGEPTANEAVSIFIRVGILIWFAIEV